MQSVSRSSKSSTCVGYSLETQIDDQPAVEIPREKRRVKQSRVQDCWGMIGLLTCLLACSLEWCGCDWEVVTAESELEGKPRLI